MFYSEDFNYLMNEYGFRVEYDKGFYFFDKLDNNKFFGFVDSKKFVLHISSPRKLKEKVDLEQFETTEELVLYINDLYEDALENNLFESTKSTKKSFKEQDDYNVWAVYPSDDLKEFLVNCDVPNYQYTLIRNDKVVKHSNFREDWFANKKKKLGYRDFDENGEDEMLANMYGKRVLVTILSDKRQNESTKSTKKSFKEKKIDLTDDDLYNLFSDCFIDSAQLIVDGDYGVHAMLYRPEVRVSAYFQFVDRQNIIQLPARDISDIEFDVNGIVFYTKNATIFVNCYNNIPKLKDRLGGWLDTTF